MKSLLISFVAVALVSTIGRAFGAAGCWRRGTSAARFPASMPRRRGRADGRHQSGLPPARLGEPCPLSRRQQDGDPRGRGLHGRLDHRSLAAAEIRRVLPRQELRRPRHQRPDDAADAHQVPSRRHRAEAAGGRHSRGHERHRRQHRPDDQRRHPEQPGVDGRARESEQHQSRARQHHARQRLPRGAERHRRRPHGVPSNASRRSTRG